MVRLTLKKKKQQRQFWAPIASSDTHVCSNQVFIGSKNSQETVASEETKCISFKVRF